MKHILLIVILAMLTSCHGIPSDAAEGSLEKAKPSVEEAMPSPSPQIAQTLPAPEPLSAPEYPQLINTDLDSLIEFAVYSEGLFCMYDGRYFDFINEDGKSIAPGKLTYAYPFSEGLACVYLDGKFGFIDKQGNVILPFIYDKANSFVEGLAYIEIGSTYGFIDKSGREAFSLNCDSVSSFSEDLANFSIDGKYGYINKRGKEVIKPLYDDAGYFKNGLAKVRLGVNFGMIDINGNEIVPIEYDDVDSSGGFMIAGSNGKTYCFNSKGEAILSAGYDSLYMDGDHYICFEVKGKFGLADEKGNELIAPEYDRLHVIEGWELAAVELEGKWGIIDFTGAVKVPISYDFIRYYGGYYSAAVEKMIEFKMGGKLGFIDLSDFSEAIPPIYDDASQFVDGCAVVASVMGREKKYGAIKENGDIVIPLEYEYSGIHDKGVIGLEKDGKRAFANKDGRILTDWYESITKIGSCYMYRTNDMYGCLNDRFEEVVPPVYGDISGYSCFDSQNFVIATVYNQPGLSQVIIKTGDNMDADLSGLLMRNEITPRIQLFHEYAKSRFMNTSGLHEDDLEDFGGNLIEAFKLYSLDESGKPVLYYHAEPPIKQRGPESFSGLYSINNKGMVNRLLTGVRPRHSTGGDRICFYKDNLLQKIVAGTYQEVLNAAGYTHGSEYYEYKNGAVEEIVSHLYNSYKSRYADKDDLLKDSGLIYDEDDIPYTSYAISTILRDEDYVTEYIVDGKRTTLEKYNEAAGRFTEIQINLR